jgi:benzoylformate decarboxylase
LLSQEITLAMTQKYCQVAKKRLEKYTRQHEQKRQAWRMRIDHHRKADPPYVDNLLDALKNALPAETIVVGEPITASRAMFEAFQFAHPGDYLGSRGGGIGQALAGAPGVKLANPDRPVAAISGDGSALYSIQSLWSAAHYRIPVIFVILNNQSYRILKVNMSRYRKFFNQSKRVDFGFMDLNDPPLDFISLAGGMGVPALRVTRLEEVRPAVIAATAAHGPFLLDCIVDGGPAPD